MNKEEILKRAQAENKDEREMQIKDKSMLWSYVAMVIVAAIFSFIRSEQGLPMISASVMAGMTYRYVKKRNNGDLLLALVMLLVAVLATIRFFMGH